MVIDDAIAEFKNIESVDPYQAQLGVASALGQRAFLVDLNNLDRKINANKICIFLFDKLMKQDSVQTAPSILSALYNISVLLAVAQDTVQEHLYFNRAFNITKGLIAKNLDQLRRFHAVILDMAEVHLNRGRADQAKYYYNLAASHYETLNLPDTDPVAEIKTNLFFRLAETYDHTQEYEKAIPYFEKAGFYSERLVGTNPHYFDSLFNAQYGVGAMKMKLGKLTDSEQDFRKAIDTMRKSLKKDPLRTATCHYHLAEIYAEVDFTVSRAHFTEMAKFAEIGASPNMPSYLIEMIGTMLDEAANYYDVYSDHSAAAKAEQDRILALGLKMSKW